MKTTLSLIFILVLASSCVEQKKDVTRASDYESYLTYAMEASKNEELKFWNERFSKDQNDETSLIKIAGLYAESFKTSGRIEDIILSDSLYNLALNKTQGGSVDLYHCLATNAITQHKFRLAKEYAEKALALKDKKAASLLILTDVSLELGDYAMARRTLKQFRNKNSFAYLIREVKLKDHEGNLDSAILLMEKAHQRVRGNKELAQWTLSNLADMYGHGGRIDEAYQTYLSVLKINPHDDYALKGIAWIALSNDHKTAEAKMIISALASRKRTPEAQLMLAEIASVQGNEKDKQDHLKKFLAMVSVPSYKTMYHKYLAIIEAEDFGNSQACITIAQTEIKNRPTPQSYDLLAWGYYHQKNISKALEIARNKVEGQTFEPDAYYHLGMIYLASGDKETSRHYLEEALESEFELGPSISKKISATLNNL